MQNVEGQLIPSSSELESKISHLHLANVFGGESYLPFGTQSMMML